MDLIKLKTENNNLYDFMIDLKNNKEFKSNIGFYKECLFEWYNDKKIIETYEKSRA